MKKYISFIAFMLFVVLVKSQDIIVTKSNDSIKCQIQSITNTVITYKLPFYSMNFTLSNDSVKSIFYTSKFTDPNEINKKNIILLESKLKKQTAYLAGGFVMLIGGISMLFLAEDYYYKYNNPDAESKANNYLDWGGLITTFGAIGTTWSLIALIKTNKKLEKLSFISDKKGFGLVLNF